MRERSSGRSTSAFPGTFTEEGTYKETERHGGFGVLKTTFTFVSGTATLTGTRSLKVFTNCPRRENEGDGVIGGSDTCAATLEVTTQSGPDARRTVLPDAGLSNNTVIHMADGTFTSMSGFMPDLPRLTDRVSSIRDRVRRRPYQPWGRGLAGRSGVLPVSSRAS